MNRTIRYAKIEDSEVLGKIHSESLQAAFKDIVPDSILYDYFSVERRTATFIRELSGGETKTAVIFLESEPAGFITFGECRDKDRDKSWIEIWRVYVVPKFWRSGISKELMEWGIVEILKEGFTNIELWVLEENIRARKFYDKIGFKQDNTIKVTNMGVELKELRYTRKIKTEKSCGAVVYRKLGTRLEFLAVKNKSNGIWGFPKGHVEEGEMEAETAQREVLEETGLDITLLSGFRSKINYWISKNRYKEVIYFIGTVAWEQPIRIQQEEIEEARWLVYEDMLNILTFENTKLVLKEAVQALN